MKLGHYLHISHGLLVLCKGAVDCWCEGPRHVIVWNEIGLESVLIGTWGRLNMVSHFGSVLEWFVSKGPTSCAWAQPCHVLDPDGSETGPEKARHLLDQPKREPSDVRVLIVVAFLSV